MFLRDTSRGLRGRLPPFCTWLCVAYFLCMAGRSQDQRIVCAGFPSGYACSGHRGGCDGKTDEGNSPAYLLRQYIAYIFASLGSREVRAV